MVGEAASAQDLPGASKEQFFAMFLTPEELPGMRMRGDFREPLPFDKTPETDAEIAAGRRYGRANWKAEDQAVAISGDVEDYIWRFPTVDEAKKY
ncbi:MAG TPA: hypothetical protein VG713_02295, partial [Pirellulales bacterium]|nr:hypothetical protein [Pirellulales bacterium]